MLIESITLQNFKVYRGKNIVKFDYDHEKNITIVSGNNGYGKTSFLTALIWCLYGKLMADVDEKYKKEIHEAGGYKKYCRDVVNRNYYQTQTSLLGTSEVCFSVSIVFSGVIVPAIPCQEIRITRVHDLLTGGDILEILVDDRENELTRETGAEIFINDFILPREIAKFFFFDAEKIVALAEMRSTEEKKQLSKAYAEVLGLKKYTDLKANLENVRIKLRKGGNSHSDKNKLTEVSNSIIENEKLTAIYEDKIHVLSDDIARKKAESDKFQERLIREGSVMTVEQLRELKDLRANAMEEAKLLKAKMHELLDFAPFAIASRKLQSVYSQMLFESETTEGKNSTMVLRRKHEQIKATLNSRKRELGLTAAHVKNIESILFDHLASENDGIEARLLLNFNTDEWNGILSIVENLKYSYAKRVKELNQQLKVNQSTFAIVNNRLIDAETKENDLVIKQIRIEKERFDKEVESLEKQLVDCKAKIIHLANEVANLKKMASELTKRINVEMVDNIKDSYASRLIKELTVFIKNLKEQKKASLEANILGALSKLMHKDNFIAEVVVTINDDYIEIDLIDRQNNVINKESLSKGEQQLYATAILKALVDQSNIKFPLFIDSPLQKFDRHHAKNIITEFYPTISDQVVLFPLLEKELTEVEFSWLKPKVSRVYKIQHVPNEGSEVVEIDMSELFIFNELNQA